MFMCWRDNVGYVQSVDLVIPLSNKNVYQRSWPIGQLLLFFGGGLVGCVFSIVSVSYIYIAMQTSLEHLPEHKQGQLRQVTDIIVKAVDPEGDPVW